MEQVLIGYVFKMIHSKALPDVNMTLAHMVLQKYFAHLKKYGNIELDNYRVYMRIIIMCRIVTITDALLQVFGVEGCDVKNQPFGVCVLRALKPYMFSTMKHAIFAATLLADEYVGPFNSIIIKTFGITCCNYYDRKKTMDLYKTRTTLKQALDRLNIDVEDVDIYRSLIRALEKAKSKSDSEKIAYISNILKDFKNVSTANKSG